MIENNIKAFSKLGKIFEDFVNGNNYNSEFYEILNNAVLKSFQENQWFIEDFVKYSIKVWALTLKEEKINQWIRPYKINVKNIKTAGVIMPGNLPLAGLHDFICVLITGNNFVGKLSSKDKVLLPSIAKILIKIDSSFKDKINFVDDSSKLSNFDFIIATGSDNTSRYFEYYFSKYPHIIRKNRVGVAVLTGNEKEKELENLADDIFLYFGLGCRNVSKIFVPDDYNFDGLFNAFKKYSFLKNHNKYYNNYEFYKAIYLVNKDNFLDKGFIILKNDTKLVSPIAVVFFEKYSSEKQLETILEKHLDKLQCICSNYFKYHNVVPLGKSQSPELWEYADNVDTIHFILNLN